MRFPLSDGFLAEAEASALRAGCRHCFHRIGDGVDARCGNGWPLEGQERWPLAVTGPDAGAPAPEVVFCREFELR